MNGSSIRIVAAGRAYQSVAQSTAIAIQDATDYLRNVSTIAVTATGVALAQIAGGNSNGTQLLLKSATLNSHSVQAFSKIARAATKVATDFPNKTV